MPPEAHEAEVVVRRRSDGATELRVDGVFVMDDAETSSERLLAEHVLADGARDVLVGGLGLGFTTHALLEGGARRVVVAELHAAVVAAVRALDHGPALLADPRLELVVDDVRTVVADRAPACLDAVVLDVDNGPDFLVHEHNAGLYGEAFVATCVRALRPGGRLSIWSMADSPALRETLTGHLLDVEAVAVPVVLQGREESYWVLTGRVGPPQGGTAGP